MIWPSSIENPIPEENPSEGVTKEPCIRLLAYLSIEHTRKSLAGRAKLPLFDFSQHGNRQDHRDCGAEYLDVRLRRSIWPSPSIQVSYARYQTSPRSDSRSRKTPVGFLHRVIWIYVPSFAGALDQRLTGSHLSRSFYRIGEYLMNEANPVVLVCMFSAKSVVRANSPGLLSPPSNDWRTSVHPLRMAAHEYHSPYPHATTQLLSLLFPLPLCQHILHNHAQQHHKDNVHLPLRPHALPSRCHLPDVQNPKTRTKQALLLMQSLH